MGLLDDGEAFLCDTFDTSESVVVAYIASPYGTPETIANVKATVGVVPSDLEDDSFSVTDRRLRDFIITASQLTISSSPYVPREGDFIDETKDSVRYRYQVVNQIGDGAWRWHGASYKAYRIHTQLVDESSV